ncbi:hypothetical protein RRG08_063441 [Elysia crispata]|uniref:Uncharacterized protein n=1 Tax=Elysia crispata TaxID=231223 RepID=A0AAE1DVF0_9GAST|nr:hypothetical protein RRG08_063441 [Elysia crispata]
MTVSKRPLVLRLYPPGIPDGHPGGPWTGLMVRASVPSGSHTSRPTLSRFPYRLTSPHERWALSVTTVLHTCILMSPEVRELSHGQFLVGGAIATSCRGGFGAKGEPVRRST